RPGRPLSICMVGPSGPEDHARFRIAAVNLPLRREVARRNGVQFCADLAVERLGVDLGVDRDRLVLARQRTLRVCARRAEAFDGAPERGLEPLAIALDGEDVADP